MSFSSLYAMSIDKQEAVESKIGANDWNSYKKEQCTMQACLYI